jgi:glycosyltransferase involved in cell wall biosynthesis
MVSQPGRMQSLFSGSRKVDIQVRNMHLPKVSFGMIVLNGEPFIRYNLRALYPFAHQIIVVEGASPGAADTASPSGHSTDNTQYVLQDFKTHEDPEHKLTIVTAEDEGYPNGIWPGEKHEQSRAYAKRATGDYLWQVDVDEFYKPQDLRIVMEMLREDDSISALSFKQITFWGGFDYVADSWFLRRGWCANGIHRVFKWGPGYHYVTHRPVTVHNAQGDDLRGLNWIKGGALARKGIYMYHYSLLFPKQVLEKCGYYKQADWSRRSEAVQWAKENFLKLRNPYRIHNVYEYPSWLERFRGNHPPEIEYLEADLRAGRIEIALRPIDDIERLLQLPTYRLGCAGLRLLEPLSRWWRPGFFGREHIKRFVRNPIVSVRNLLQTRKN